MVLVTPSGQKQDCPMSFLFLVFPQLPSLEHGYRSVKQEKVMTSVSRKSHGFV